MYNIDVRILFSVFYYIDVGTIKCNDRIISCSYILMVIVVPSWRRVFMIADGGGRFTTIPQMVQFLSHIHVLFFNRQ